MESILGDFWGFLRILIALVGVLIVNIIENSLITSYLDYFLGTFGVFISCKSMRFLGGC